MSRPIIKKGAEILMVITGFILFILSFSLLSKPNANQGVTAMPHRSSLSVKNINRSQAIESSPSAELGYSLIPSTPSEQSNHAKTATNNSTDNKSSIKTHKNKAMLSDESRREDKTASLSEKASD